MAIAEARRFVRADGPDKVTGSGRYVADMNLTGQLVAKFKYAGVAHARIMRLDVSSARAIPGVFAVLTAADVPDVVYSPVVPDRRLFATEVVRFEGELLAAVAAVDAATAQAAVDAIVVEYEPLPIVDDLEAAIAKFKGTEAAVCFTSAYAANASAVQTLLGKEDIVVSDQLNHASIIDAVKVAGVQNKFRYDHSDMGDLEKQLKAARLGLGLALG